MINFDVNRGEFIINTEISGDDTKPTVVTLANGGFAVVWLREVSCYSSDLYGQVYDAGGNKLDSEFRINTYITGNKNEPIVTALFSGGFVVTWESAGQDGSVEGIFAQRYDASGGQLGGVFQCNTEVVGSQFDPSVIALKNGGFVVTWSSYDGDGYGIFGQVYDAAGTALGKEFQVNTYGTGSQKASSVTALTGGGFVVTWSSEGLEDSEYGIFGQQYDSSGNKLGEEFQINTNSNFSQYSPTITPLTDGGFVVTWSNYGQDGSQGGIFGQCYDAGGMQWGEELQINTYTTDYQYSASVTALTGGGFVVTWSSEDQDGSGSGIFGQRFDAAGNKLGGEIQVNTYTAGNQDSSSVTALTGGGFVVTWSSYGQDGSGYGVFAQLYTAVGDKLGGEFRCNTYTTGSQENHSVAALADGGFVVTWESAGQDGCGSGIFGQRYDSEGNPYALGLNQQEQTIADPTSTVTIGAMFATLAYGDICLAANPDISSNPLSASTYYNTLDEGFDDNYREYFENFKVLGETWTILDDTNGLTLTNTDVNTHAGFTSNNLDGEERISYGLYHSYIDGTLHENQCHTVDGITYGDSNALVVVSGDTLVLAFRGTDGEDHAFDAGQSWSGDGEYLHYEAFRPLLDAIGYYLDSHAEVKHVIVSGHSLGGAMADLFTTIDARYFATPNDPTRDLAIVSIGSPGIDPDAFSDAVSAPDDPEVFKNFDKSVLEIDTSTLNDTLKLTTPEDFYYGIAHNHDRVYYAWELGDITYTPNDSLIPNVNFPVDQIKLPNIDNGDVDYKTWVFPNGFGAHHNKLIYWRNMYALSQATVSYRNQELIFGVGTYTFGLPEVGVAGSGWWDPSWGDDDGEAIHDAGTRALKGTANDNFLFGLEGNDELYGEGGCDYLSGGSGNDKLDGGSGADVMEGGAGNDTYHVGVSGDVLKEKVNEGIDTVFSLVTYRLGDNLEKLTLTGFGSLNGYGNSQANTLTGNVANNILDGDKGIDIMKGGEGNDTYYVDNSSDVTVETSLKAMEIDTVYSGVDRALGPWLENLTLTGTVAINATGNFLHNTLKGNSLQNFLYGLEGNDRLDGGAGSDRMIGGKGNDTYYVDNAGDVVIESSALGAETDTVESTVSWTLGTNFEKLTLKGTSAINGTGNGLNNTLVGNTAANVLNGGVGADSMVGGLGNDTYYVDTIGDGVSETSTLATEIDTVVSTVNRILGANQERLVLAGTLAIQAIGNALGNVMTGNGAANTLSGAGGNDTLNSGGGNDILIGGTGSDGLIGGAGKDIFVFDTTLNATTNKDSLTDFSVVDDTIRLDRTIFAQLTTLGTLNSVWFKPSTSGKALDSNDYLLYNTTTGALLYDKDATGTGAATQFATLTTRPKLTAADFVVVA